jgi:hypothetical protein
MGDEQADGREMAAAARPVCAVDACAGQLMLLPHLHLLLQARLAQLVQAC